MDRDKLCFGELLGFVDGKIMFYYIFYKIKGEVLVIWEYVSVKCWYKFRDI